MTSPRHVEAGVGVLTVHSMDALSALREMPDESVQCVVTSPPYWSLRDYGIEPIVWDETVECEHEWGAQVPGDNRGGSGPNGKNGYGENYGRDAGRGNFCFCGAWRGCLGLEPTPELYVQHIVQIFREVKRVLRKDGTLWLNLGDSYFGDSPTRKSSSEAFSKEWDPANSAGNGGGRRSAAKSNGLKPKDLCGIPWRVAFALQADGWWLRSDIIWSKPNPMPESVTDRPTRAHEYIFLLTKSQKYFYDAEAIKEPSESNRPDMAEKGVRTGLAYLQQGPLTSNSVKPSRNGKNSLRGQGANRTSANGPANREGRDMQEVGNDPMRNKRSVWEIATAPFPEAHFATFPKDLVIPCVLAGTSARGCCSECGAPWERTVERSPMEINRSNRGEQIFGNAHSTVASGTMTKPPESRTTGWESTCTHDAPIDRCVVLDPFGGSGTVGKVAIELGRKAILIEPNPEYVKMIEKRTTTTMGLPL